MSQSKPVILAARRTPIGKFLGMLSRVPAPQLGSYVAKALFTDVPGSKERIDECLMGNVLQAGVGQNPARQVGLLAGLPDTLTAMTINKVCGSGLQAVMTAAQGIRAGDNQLVLAGGIENMDLAPHMIHMRNGVKFGDAKLLDHMQADGLTCAFEKWGMGFAADYIAQKHSVSREDQDRFSVQSHHRAAHATKEGWFKNEIVALTPEQTMQKTGLDTDEGFRADSTIEGLAKLKAVFAKDGTVTAGNASQISDGAAAVLVASEAMASSLGRKPIARIIDQCTAGVAPKELFFAPKLGIEMILQRNGLKASDIDLFEINEAFAAQILCNIKPLGISEDRLNIGGGGIALGHPIGASGARVLVTLLHHLARTGGKRGICSLCLGGGNAVSMLVEMV
ncbi:MAG: thiolase family protein [Phycisphaerae bacterium]|jgi:acetyl-CoA C-acetyltransferase|nr:thiolase family protein [Phycisphaerae bacterium]